MTSQCGHQHAVPLPLCGGLLHRKTTLCPFHSGAILPANLTIPLPLQYASLPLPCYTLLAFHTISVPGRHLPTTTAGGMVAHIPAFARHAAQARTLSAPLDGVAGTKLPFTPLATFHLPSTRAFTYCHCGYACCCMTGGDLPFRGVAPLLHLLPWISILSLGMTCSKLVIQCDWDTFLGILHYGGDDRQGKV